MKLVYVANARIPTERAHGIQIMKMCEAFASQITNNKVELVLPMELFNRIKESPFDYYGVKRIFKIKKLFTLNFLSLNKRFGRFGFWFKSAIFNSLAFLYVFFKKTDIIYTREKFLILPLSFFKKNLILEVHTFPKNYFLYHSSLKKLKGITVITEKLKNRFVEKGMPPNKILVAADGVDLAVFDVKNTQEECRGKLNLPQGKKIVLYAGHLYGWKGADILVGASRFLPEEVMVYFVGGTDEDVKDMKVRCSNIQNIRIVGHKPYSEIPYWLKAADVLVLPNSGKEDISKYWTSPIKMFEYMASQRPIVASSLPSIREVLNEENAILVEPDKPEALAQSIKEVLQNPQLSDRVSARAFQDVREYTWQKRAENILKFISNDLWIIHQKEF